MKRIADWSLRWPTVRWPSDRPGRRRVRGGNVLVLFAMMLFALMGLAALVIDLGFARLAQRQMQTAVDSAAIEGLRFRDELPPGVESAINFDRSRREHASQVVAWHFDDNLLADDEDPYQFGGGPIVEFSGGEGEPGLAASQLMTLPGVPVYKPVGVAGLQFNDADNAAEGDMVAGTFSGSWPPIELANYNRVDFEPEPDGDAFLVRMRRTNDLSGLDNQSDISSSGPTLPLLFARGSMLHRESIASGITVRATAIADLRPVVCVGGRSSISVTNVVGSLGAAVALVDWEGASIDDPVPAVTAMAQRLGEVVAGDPPTPENEVMGYVAIYDEISELNRVIGFGYGGWDDAGNVTKKSLGSGGAPIAAENASAVFCLAVDGPTEGLDEVLQRNRDLQGHTDILHAPISVR